MKVRLYRGITVEPEEADMVRQDVLENGLRVTGKENWKVELQFFKDRIDKLYSKSDLNESDTRPSHWVKTHNGGYQKLENAVRGVYATGGPIGATYYATKHNSSSSENRTKALLITFQSEIEDLIIDGKDFLYTVFGLCRNERGRRAMLQLYGENVERYWEAAMGRDPRDSVAYCDLVTQDYGCIEHHLKNTVLIGGRHNTLFESAFAVKIPISAEDVLEVSSPSQLPKLSPGISLGELPRSE